MKSCFFIGHRNAPAEIYPALQAAVERHVVEFGVTEFFVGDYGAFDRMAARAVIAQKQRHPDIILSMLLPYHPAERPIELPPGFDNSYYPPLGNVPRRFAIVRANRYMVSHIDYLIAYAWHPASNARELLQYALRRKIKVTNLRKSPESH